MVDLDGMLGGWETAGYSETQATACEARVEELLGERTEGIKDDGERRSVVTQVFPEVLAQATRDVPPDLIPPATERGTRAA